MQGSGRRDVDLRAAEAERLAAAIKDRDMLWWEKCCLVDSVAPTPEEVGNWIAKHQAHEIGKAVADLERRLKEAVGALTLARQAIIDARGLCVSEANRWAGGDQPSSKATSDHWSLVATRLLGLEVTAAAIVAREGK